MTKFSCRAVGDEPLISGQPGNNPPFRVDLPDRARRCSSSQSDDRDDPLESGQGQSRRNALVRSGGKAVSAIQGYDVEW